MDVKTREGEYVEIWHTGVKTCMQVVKILKNEREELEAIVLSIQKTNPFMEESGKKVKLTASEFNRSICRYANRSYSY